LFVDFSIFSIYSTILVDLRANLKRLRLPPNGEITLNAESTVKSLAINGYLTQLIRQGYLDQQLVGQAKGAASKKRGRAAASSSQPEEGGTYEWRWGPRAQSEVGEKAIAAFVAEFMVERVGEGENDRDGEESAAARKKRREAALKRLGGVLKGVQRAAGGELMDIQ
jgi:hypothetical protein